MLTSGVAEGPWRSFSAGHFLHSCAAAAAAPFHQRGGWRELEQALADRLLGGPLNPSPVLCEWAYLGREGLEVYLYVHCSNTEPIQEGGDDYPGVSVPILVVCDVHGGIQEVQAPGSGTRYPQGIRRLFPPRVQEMIFERQIDFRALSDHLALRREDPDLPPLYVSGGGN